MADYNSKRTGEQIEALLDIVQQGGSGGGSGEVEKTTEAEITAMGFTKNLGTITEVKMNGASKGTSGVVDLGTVITEHQDISGKVDKVSGKGLSTNDFTTALKTKLEGLSNYDDTAINSAVTTLRSDFDKLVSGDTTTAIKTFNEIIAFLDGIADSESLDNIISSIEQQIAGKMDKVTLAKVATSGSYNDLSDKPTIPSAVTESTVSGWGFTKNTGTYSKPSGGIPKTDLASAVQTSLGKADTALQSYTEQYKGTVTGVKVNGLTYSPTNGIVDLGTISGGGSSGGGGDAYAGNYPIIELSDRSGMITLIPNTYYKFTEALTGTVSIEFAKASNTSIVNEYVVEFYVYEDLSIAFPGSIKWANDNPPTIEKAKNYVISIVNNIGAFIVTDIPSSGLKAVLNVGNNKDGVDVYKYIVANSTYDGVSRIWDPLQGDEIIINGNGISNVVVTGAWIENDIIYFSWKNQGMWYAELTSIGNLYIYED